MAQAYLCQYHGRQLLKQDKCLPRCPLDKPRIWLDFNEFCGETSGLLDLYAFSQGDIVNDSDGNDVLLCEGLAVSVFDDDEGEDGAPDALLADGVILPNTLRDYPRIKWLIRLKPTNGRYRSGNPTCYWMSDLSDNPKGPL